MKEISHTVSRQEAGRTVAALLHECGGVSHKVARGIVDAGLVQVDGEPAADPVARLREGSVLRARFDPATRYRPVHRRPSVGPGFRMILEDDDLMVVDKAAGIPTVPSPGDRVRSLMDRLLAREGPAGKRRGLWVVHRIDRDVSGLVVVARSAEALQGLRSQFTRRTPLRQYRALCESGPPAAEGRLVSRLAPDPRTRRMKPVQGGGGKDASLRYRVLERYDRGSLLEIRLETGRRNQIRVQCAEHGFPVVGDPWYGRPSPLLERVALHAVLLEFLHPRSGRAVSCSSEPPADFLQANRRLRAGASPRSPEISAGGRKTPPKRTRGKNGPKPE